MENNQINYQEISYKNQMFLKEYVKLSYNLRNNYLLFGYGLSSNNEQVFDEAFKKLNDDIQRLEMFLSSFSDFYKSLKINSENLNINKEELYKYFQENYIRENFRFNLNSEMIIRRNSISLLYLNNSKEYKEYFKEVIFNKLIFSFKKIQKKFPFNLEGDNNFENKITNCLDKIKVYINENYKNNIDIKYNLNKFNINHKNIYIEISIFIGNIFIISVYFEIYEFIDYEKKKKYITKTKMFIKGKKEIFSFQQNPYLKMKKVTNINSKFLIYKKLKNYLLEKFDLFLKTREAFYPEFVLLEIFFFIYYLSYYTKIFNQKCFICNKLVKYSLIDKIFYPPFVLLFPYNSLCHEECFYFYTYN